MATPTNVTGSVGLTLWGFVARGFVAGVSWPDGTGPRVSWPDGTGTLNYSEIAKVSVPSGRCEKIDLETWSNFDLEKNRARMPCERLPGLRHTFRLRRNFTKSIFSHLPGHKTSNSSSWMGSLPVFRKDKTTPSRSALPSTRVTGQAMAAQDW
jgi:hypothetical protein